MSFFEPSPALYAFLFIQTFLFVPVVIALSVARFAVAKGPSRLLAFGAVVVGALVLFLQFGPALLGLYEGMLPQIAGQATRALSGMALPLAPSAVLVASGMVAGRRWFAIDVVHFLCIAGFAGLYAWTRLG
ncbi:hypothetical protein ACS3SW_01270 [Roseobacteraceae bacterium S113]